MGHQRGVPSWVGVPVMPRWWAVPSWRAAASPSSQVGLQRLCRLCLLHGRHPHGLQRALCTQGGTQLPVDALHRQNAVPSARHRKYPPGTCGEVSQRLLGSQNPRTHARIPGHRALVMFMLAVPWGDLHPIHEVNQGLP